MTEIAMRSRSNLAPPILLVIVAAYLLVGTLYAVQTPPWQAPDEPAHYNYIRQLAGGRIPVMEMHDYDEAYRADIVSAGFAPPYTIEPLTYEDWQPPLYYLLQTPIFLLFEGALLPLRLFSLVLGAAMILLTYRIARLLWPEQAWQALTATAFVAFLPQHVAMLASVNNDSLAELLISALLLLLLLATVRRPEAMGRFTGNASKPGKALWFVIGILLGLGFLTKATVYIMAPVLALALICLYWQQWGRLLQASLLSFVPAALLGSLWWLRNLWVYGWPDLLGKGAHDAAVIGQKQTATLVAEIGAAPALRSFLQTTFQSFWGQFGWMGVVMDRRVYLTLFLFTLLVIAGTILSFRRRTERGLTSNPHFLILAATFILSVAVYLGYNVTYVQHQGRYLFSALIPVSLAVAVGISAWFRPLVARWRLLAWLIPAGLGLALVGLDLLALFHFIVPALT